MHEAPPDLRRIFGEALERESPEAREAYLDEACRGDAMLRDRVDALLSAHGSADTFLGPADPEPLGAGPGDRVGPYELLEHIGAGGFGVVFLAEQRAPVRRRVALKLIRPGMDTREVLARFEAERQALALMDHPAIARILDGGSTEDGRPYFAMELVRGIPMTGYCDRSNLPLDERLELFVQVCHAVQHAHQKGIIHRDLKPSNVLVAIHDGAPAPKVIDFGVAKAMGPQLTERTFHTRFAQMLGTPMYMSPEQAEMSPLDVDTRSDVYSLGVLLYELLVGTPPFTKEQLAEATFDELRRLIREQEPETPSTRLRSHGAAVAEIAEHRRTEPGKLRQAVKGDLDCIVMKALEKDRTRRYESASALAADVVRYLRHEPVEAGPPSRWYRIRKFARRNRGGVMLAALVMVLLVSAAAATGWVASERSARRLLLEQQVTSALDETARWYAAGQPQLARAALERAEGLATAGRADAALWDRVRTWRRDLDMVAAIEAARLAATTAQADPLEGRSTGLLPALRGYGIDLSEAAHARSVARIRSSRIRGDLIAALYEESSRTRSDAQRRRVQRVIAGCDDDPWRGEVREAERRSAGEALAALAKEARAIEQPPASILWLARSLNRAGGRGDSMELLRRTQRKHPDDLWINIELGVELRRRHVQDPEALGYLLAALALRPGSPAIHDCIAASYIGLGDPKAAMRASRRAIALAPDDPQAHSNLGTALLLLGDADGACSSFQRALELDPRTFQAHCSKAALHRARGQMGAALHHARTAVALAPDHAPSQATLGAVCTQLGDLEGGLRHLERAVSLDPSLARAHCMLGECLSRLGRHAAAIAAVEGGRALAPEDARSYLLSGKVWLRTLGAGATRSGAR